MPWLFFSGVTFVGLDLLDYFFVKLMPVFSLMPIMLEPPFSATRYASFFLCMLVLLLVFVASFLVAYACFRRLCSSPRFLPLGMPVFIVYARTYARFVTSFLAVFACFRRLCSRYGEISIFLHCFTCTAFDLRGTDGQQYACLVFVVGYTWYQMYGV